MKSNVNEHKSAIAIFEILHNCVLNYDADGQAELFAENGVWELPLAPLPIPREIKGREAIRMFGKAGMDASRGKGRKTTKYQNVKIHATSDENIIICEFELLGKFEESGEEYKIPFIQVIHVKDGYITRLKDYFAFDMINKPQSGQKI